MREYIQRKANAYKGINDIALKGEIVIFGSSYMANFPFYELINKFHLDSAVYNRSIDGMTSGEAEELLRPCVLDIAPRKIFLQLGEADVSLENAENHYKAILHTIQMCLPDTKIYMIGNSGENEVACRLNEEMKCICDNERIFYIPFAYQKQDLRSSYTKQFKQLTRFFRDRPIDLSDAFAMAGL